MHHVNLHLLLSGLRKQDTVIRIPKFKVEESYDLKSILRHLGISEIFDRTAANFTKMVSPELNSHGVKQSRQSICFTVQHIFP
jgi:serine protease inhibitor